MQRRRAVGGASADIGATVEQTGRGDSVAALRRVTQSVIDTGCGRFNRKQRCQTKQTYT